MKLGLGTVQFGLDYGIANKDGKVADDAIQDILDVAQQAGITILDTAAQYGSSEDLLGRSMPNNNHFNIVTKTPFIASDVITPADADLITTTFHASLEKLNQQSLYGLLLHNANDMHKDNFKLVWHSMQALKQQGLVQKIGLSVYTSQQIDYALEHYLPDLIQLPFNVFDQRLLHSGHLAKLKKYNVQIHARSVFLQGLLLMKPEHVPAKLHGAIGQIKKYHDQTFAEGMSTLEASLGFVVQQPDIDCVIVGVCSSAQLQEIVAAEKKVHDSNFDFAPFALQDEKILNPALWKL